MAFKLQHFIFGSKSDKKMLVEPLVHDSLKRLYQEAFRQGLKGPEYDLKIFTNDWGFEAKNIKAQVYLWYGEDDQAVSLNMGKYYASQIRGSKLKIYPKEGHLIFRTHIEEILRTLI